MPKVGVAAAVNPATTGTPQGGQDRVIVVGDNMLHNERIETSAKGRTQLLFIDGTALTIGPNSSVVLDEFVYDPKTKVGKLAFSATKGLFRLVGGRISKTTPVIFKTPTAVIGIRGGIGIITIRERKRQAQLDGGLSAGDGGSPAPGGDLRLAQSTPGGAVAGDVVTTAQLAYGQMTVSAGGVTQAINVPGFQVVSVSPDQAPSRPTPVPPPTGGPDGGGFTGLEGTGGDSTGGAPKPPTNEDVADTQISDMGSNIQPKLIVAAPTFNDAPPPPPPGGVVGDGEKLLLVSKDTRIAEQNNALDDKVGTTDGMRNIGISNNSAYGGRFLSQTPFTGFDFNTGKTTAVSLRNSRGSDGAVNAGFLTAPNGFGGSNFKLPVKEGFVDFGSADAFTRFGPVSGMSFGAPDQSFYYFNLREVNFSNNPSSLFGGVPFTGAFPTGGTAAHDLFPGFPGKTSIPMLPENYGGNFGGALNPILYTAYSPNLTTFPNDDRAVALYALIAIDGVGPSQKSAMTTYTGVYIGDSGSNNHIFLAGYNRGSVRLTSGGTPIRVSGGGGTTSRDSLGRSFFGQDKPDHFVISSDVFTQDGTLFDAAGFVRTLENTSVPALVFFHETYSRPAPLPNGAGSVRTSQTLKGYAAGIVTTKVSGSISTYIAKNLNDQPGSFQITTSPAINRATAVFRSQDAFNSQSSMVVYFGNPSGASSARQAFIDDNIFGIRESTSQTDTIGGSASTGRIALVTSAFVNLSIPATAGVTFCTCAHTKWGFISGEVHRDDFSELQRLHLMPWVAGRLSGPGVTAGKVGTASYGGHAVANIMNASGQEYVAFGNYNQSWNFANRTGLATISNLDGATYSGSIVNVSGTSGSEFVGGLSGAGRSGSIFGAFMRGANNNTGEVAAQFHVTGSGYYAAGIAVGKEP